MSKTLDEEWLADAIPTAIELCEEWSAVEAIKGIKDKTAIVRLIGAKDIMRHAAGEIRAQRTLISNLRKRIDQLELELERLHEPDDDRPDW